MSKLNRRGFLQTGAALAASTLLPAAPPASRQPRLAQGGQHGSFDPWVEVFPAHLQHNVREVARLTQRPILAVVKNNGYGLGVAEAAQVLEGLPEVTGLAVVKLQEAMTLRDRGIKKPILLIGPATEKELAESLARNITPMVYTPIGDLLERLAARRQRPVPIQVCVDTGIGRVGVPYRQAATLIRDLASRKGVRFTGTLMTFTEDPEFDPEQLRRFLALTDGLKSEGVRLGVRHAVSSTPLFTRKDACLDQVRPGLVLYGVYPSPDFRKMGLLDLRPAVALRTRVLYVKQLEAGDAAGYNRAYKASRPTWIATLPIGHADGWPRAAAKGAKVRIGDRLYPVIASVSASHTLVELGENTSVKAGDTATCFDHQEGSRPEDLAATCGASVYDLLMHLNPLLPRKILAALKLQVQHSPERMFAWENTTLI